VKKIQNGHDLAIVMRERAKSAKVILGPGCDDALVDRMVWAMVWLQLRKQQAANFSRKPTNTDEKKAIDRVGRELHRLNAALNSSNFPNFARKLFPPNLRKLQKELENLAALPLSKPKRSSDLQKNAAAFAAALLKKQQVPLMTTRGGKFHKLAAVLYGKDDADLFNHCRVYRDMKL
jgi:hypothetical protein